MTATRSPGLLAGSSGPDLPPSRARGRTLRPAALLARAAVALVPILLAVGVPACSPRAPAAGEDGAATGAAARAPADTADPDTPRAASDSLPPARTASDDPLRALRDSARSLRERGGHGREEEVSGDTISARDARPPAAADTAGGYPHGPVTTTDVDRLRELGPVYTPYDRGPVLEPDGWLDGLLRAALVPAIRKYGLAPDTYARFWVLVDAEGRVRATERHLSSGHAAFDSAARAVAERLRYAPAVREEAPVPVWVLARISVLMQ